MIVVNNILDVELYVSDLELVVFDLDDTLYSEKEYVRSGFHQIGKLFPCIPDAEIKLWSFFLEGKKAIDCFLDAEQIPNHIKDQCLEVYRNHKPRIHLYPGVYEMLLRLKKSYKLGLITDGRPEGQRAKIEALNLKSLFDQIIITDELGGILFRKPNPKAFQIMSKALSAEYHDMCYIGDNLKKDIVVAEMLGIKAIHFQNIDGLYK